jgi:alginate O-acetyltransferase complex protein AlgI
MVFSSLTFVCLFLPIALALYHGAPHSIRNWVLVGASIVFYLWGGKAAIILVLLSIAANFALGQAIARAGAERRTRLIRWSVAGNLLVLIAFKYADFIVDNVNLALEPSGWTIPNPNVPLPLGISFITFHILSYLIDVYRGVAEPQRSPVPFALYILNFPQLIAGPIIRYRPMSPQLGQRPISFEDIDIGVTRFVAGLAKKLLIANPIGAVADQLFAIEPADLPVWALWLAVICYALQIYFDFSGYSDMAIGIARMFGSDSRKISTIHIGRFRSRISGGVGTLRSRRGSAITSIFRSAAATVRCGGPRSISGSCFYCAARGMARAGISSSGAYGTACSCQSNASVRCGGCWRGCRNSCGLAMS